MTAHPTAGATGQPPPPGSSPPPPASANQDRRQLLKNVVANYASFAVGLALSAVQAPILLHRVGAADFGLLAFLQGLASYAGLLEAGVSTSAVQRYARFAAEGDESALRTLTVTCRRFFLAATVVSAVVVGAATPLLGYVAHVRGGRLAEAQMVFVLLGSGVLASFLSMTYAAMLFGMGRSSRSSWTAVVLNVGSRAVTLVVVLLGGGILGVAAVGCASAVASSVAIVVVARRTFPSLDTAGVVFSGPMFKDMLRSGRNNAVIAVSSTMAIGLDTAVIGFVRPVSEVAPYSLSAQMVTTTRSVATLGTDQLAPGAAHTKALGREAATLRIFEGAVLVAVAVFVPLAAGMMAFGPQLLRIWLGRAPAQTYEVLVVLSVAALVQLPSSQAFRVLTAIDQNRALAVLALPAAAGNLAISVVCTMWWGPVGPAVGTLAVAVVLDFAVVPLLTVKTLGGNRMALVRDVLGPSAALAVVAGATAVLLRLAVPAGELPALGGCAGICAVVWCAALLILRRSVVGEVVTTGLRGRFGAAAVRVRGPLAPATAVLEAEQGPRSLDRQERDG